MPKIVDKDAKRMELLQAATKVFARNGYALTKVADVAEVAGVGKGTIYEYFDTKADLFWAVCENLVTWPHDVEVYIEDPVAGFKSLIWALVESYEASEAFFLVLLDYWAAILRDKKRRLTLSGEPAEKLYAYPRRLISSVIQAGQQSGVFSNDVRHELVSVLAVAGIEGLRSQKMQDPRHVDFNDCVDALIDSLLGYLKSDRKTAPSR